jgi:hypothetical protein
VKPETAQEKSKPAPHTEETDEIERFPLIYAGINHHQPLPTAAQVSGD